MDLEIKERIQQLNPKAKELLLAKLVSFLNSKKGNNTSSDKKELVAYIEGKEGFSVENLKAHLKNTLPNYMIPSSIIHLKNMPLLPNGKIDRKRLSGLKKEEKPKTNFNKVNTSLEEKLIKIWEEALGFSPINTTDNFFEIGGDSILSIQIIAKARKKGIILKSNDIFEYQNIAELAMFAKYESEEKRDSELIQNELIGIWEEVLGFSPINTTDNFFEIGGDSILSIQINAKARKKGIILKPNQIFEHQTIAELVMLAETAQKAESVEISKGKAALLPIQHWFFENHKNEPNYWNQGVRINNLPYLSKEKIAEVSKFIVNQHDALRLKFTKKEHWESRFVDYLEVNAFQYFDISSENKLDYQDIALKIQKEAQQEFRLEQGSLFQCLYFNTGKSDANFCLLIAHHLVVDAVSWQIITDDFISAVKQIQTQNKLKLQPKTTSIQTWGEYLKETSDKVQSNELGFWKDQMQKVKPLPVDNVVNNLTIKEKEIKSEIITFTKEDTRKLTEIVNKTYHTKTEELIVVALIDCIAKWNTTNAISIGFERHGRETQSTDFDLSKTVGWFTSYFPLRFNFEEDSNLKTKIISVKEKMRSIPSGGIGYGVLRYLKNSFGSAGNPEIVFNFLGTQNSLLKDKIAVVPLSKNLRSPESERDYKLEVNALINEGRLTCTWNYSSKIYNESSLKRLITDFNNLFLEIISHCENIDNEIYTPSDFAGVDISQDDLDSLMGILE